MNPNRAKFRLKILGGGTIILSVISIYLQGSATIESTPIYILTNTSQTDFQVYTMLRMVSYLTLFLFAVSGSLLITIRSIAAKLLLITSVLSFLIVILPFIFFFAPAHVSISKMDILFKLEKISSFAAEGHVLFGLCLFQFWAPAVAFKYFRELSETDNTNENEAAFNNAIESDRE